MSYHVGQELPPLIIDAVDPEKMKIMAAILRDPNPIHYDPERVAALGLGGRVINQGPTNMSYLLNMVTRWSGGVPTLRSTTVRFLGNVFAGDRVQCTGRVIASDDAAGVVTLEVQASVDGRLALQGSVTVST